MRRMKRFAGIFIFAVISVFPVFATPVTVAPVTASHGMVVAGHPQAAAAGVATLQAGGNAIDAAIATSLALGVAEPYASGLGGKLMLLYYEAKSGRTYALDAMDAAGSLDAAAYRRRPEEDRSYGYGAVCVPGLAAGLWALHEKWGALKWADDVRPSIQLARDGFEVLPKTRDFFEEQDKKLRRGDAEIARLYLPGGKLPVVGSFLPNADLAHTLELLAAHGRDGFYRGPVAEAIVAASQQGGGVMTLDDLAHYEAHFLEPLGLDFHGYHLTCAPPPASGPAQFLTIMKVLEGETFGGGPLRTAANLDRIGRVWKIVEPQVWRMIGDTSDARASFEKLISPDSIRAIREKAFSTDAGKKAAGILPTRDPIAGVKDENLERMAGDEEFYEDPVAATTHFVVVDVQGNIVSATQSLSLHFGAGVVPPGTGVVLNNSMSNFSFTDSRNPNYVAPGRRPHSTIAPTIVFRAGKPVFAIGIPGSARIPTAMLQVLLDRLVLNRPLAEAIGDTRVHYESAFKKGDEVTFEAEQSFPAADAAALRALGWKVVLPEAAGRGRHFGGINAIEFNSDGTLTGYADPRRTNVAVGY
jgi:gamma-glutamyltranspeptidase/glutathione hydrolase